MLWKSTCWREPVILLYLVYVNRDSSNNSQWHFLCLSQMSKSSPIGRWSDQNFLLFMAKFDCFFLHVTFQIYFLLTTSIKKNFFFFACRFSLSLSPPLPSSPSIIIFIIFFFWPMFVNFPPRVLSLTYMKSFIIFCTSTCISLYLFQIPHTKIMPIFSFLYF